MSSRLSDRMADELRARSAYCALLPSAGETSCSVGTFDDAVALEPPAGCDLVLKTDWLIQRCAFFPDVPWMPWPIRPCPLISLPKDAHPLGFLLAIELPREIGPEWLEPFARGLDEHSERGGGP